MYDYRSIGAIKFLVRKEDLILLLREPMTNEWMPGRLGMPGGKPTKGETLFETMDRKIKTEIGLTVTITGIARIMNVIMPQGTVYYFLVAAEYVDGEIDTSKIEADEISWYSPADIQALTNDDFTEYFNREFILDFLAGTITPAPIDLIHTQDSRSGAAAEWMAKADS